MANRTFKRVLSETSLERKCRFLFGACLLLLITASFWFYGQRTELLVREQNVITGRVLVERSMLLHHWEEHFVKEGLADVQGHTPWVTLSALSEHLATQEYEWSFLGSVGAKGIRPTEQFEESMIRRFLDNTPGGEVDTTTIGTPGDPPPTDSTNAENGNATSQEPEGATTSPPDNGGNEQFSTIPAVEYYGQDDPDRNEYHYYQAIRAKSWCIDCHRLEARPIWFADAREPFVLKAGDLMGIVKVTIPTDATVRELNLNRAILLATAIITVFLAVVAAWFIVRYVIVNPLKHLRDVSDAVSRGNIDMRANLQTADEFEELGVAFNRMLRHLVAVQQELREVNSDLDLKVDELAQANMQLFEMNRLKSDFLATMSHELRTPLNSIIGFSEVLGSIDSLDDKQQRYVENIQKSGRVLLDMINEVLDLAKLESGKMEVRLSSFRIEHVIAAQCDMARPLTERKNIDLETSIAPGLLELRQDQAKVQQILNNLLSNAIKFTPEGGRIVVEARRNQSGDLTLTVTDTGVGIAEEDQTNIFEKFRQGASVLSGGDAMTRQYTGTGLGLSIVKELCRLLGGEIWLKSELGKGSSFTVRLPWMLVDQPRMETPLDGAPIDLGRFARGGLEDEVSAPLAPGVKLES